jgi:hypothetical protein
VFTDSCNGYRSAQCCASGSPWTHLPLSRMAARSAERQGRSNDLRQSEARHRTALWAAIQEAPGSSPVLYTRYLHSAFLWFPQSLQADSFWTKSCYLFPNLYMPFTIIAKPHWTLLQFKQRHITPADSTTHRNVRVARLHQLGVTKR